MKRLSLLMYHGLYASEAQRLAIDPIDRPYAISAEVFARQLDLLAKSQIPVIHPRALERKEEPVPGGVLLTFDDGHASNAEIALPLLKQRGLSALFFVTTDFVGERSGFCTWDQIRSLTQGGMVVGGHGQTHRFLSDLPDDALRGELQGSHARLEHELQVSVKQMSFPGGRCDSRSIEMARESGFAVLHGSDVGTLPAQHTVPLQPLPRLAIRANTSSVVFLEYAQAKMGRILWAKTTASVKTLVKRVLGNERYHQLYTRVKGVPAQQP